MSKLKTLNYWELNFQKSGIKPELIEIYMAYINNLLDNNMPIIFDFNHLCLLLGRNRNYLASVINSNISHYRIFSIPKRSGGYREITAPYPALIECQNWIYKNILLKIRIHPAAQGFTFKKSIITNAKIHIGQKHFLKIDLKDFFPSITINQVMTIFKSLGYTNKVAYYLSAICCYGDVLPQGASTSPALSNIIGRTLDKRLFAFAKAYNLRYTRYADDLAFSGEEIPVKFLDYISSIIESCGFSVNEKKTILQQKDKAKRIITGISISDETIKVPREYKRKLKQEIHCIRKFGISSHIRRKKIKKTDYLLSIIGKTRFWLSVEPDNQFAIKALNDLFDIYSSD
jgi:retron-type reverse transcriptase